MKHFKALLVGSVIIAAAVAVLNAGVRAMGSLIRHLLGSDICSTAAACGLMGVLGVGFIVAFGLFAYIIGGIATGLGEYPADKS